MKVRFFLCMFVLGGVLGTAVLLRCTPTASVLGQSQSSALINIPTLIEAIDAEDVNTRLNATEALGYIAHGIHDTAEAKSAVRSLLTARGDEDEQVQQAAAVALHQLVNGIRVSHPNRGVLDGLLESLNDPDPEWRSNAVEALDGVMYAPSTGGFLHSMIASRLSAVLQDESSQVRVSAAKVTLHLADWMRDDLMREQAVQLLAELLTDQDPRVRLNAAETVASPPFGDSARPTAKLAVGGAIEILREGQDPAIRRRAAAVLRGLAFIMQDQELRKLAIQALAQAQEDTDPYVRVRAAAAWRASAPWTDEQAVGSWLETLREARAGANVDLRREIVDSVGYWPQASRSQAIQGLICSFLTEELQTNDPVLRTYAATALARAAVLWENTETLHSAISAVLKGLTEDDVRARRISAESLQYVASKVQDQALSKAVLQQLLATVSDPDAGVRRNTIATLERLATNASDEDNSQQFLQPLVQSLKDEYPQVRNSGVSALIRIAFTDVNDDVSRLALNHLADLIKDTDTDVQTRFLKALGAGHWLGDSRDSAAVEVIMPSVVAVLKSEDANVRREAVSAVRNLASRITNEKTWAAITPILVTSLDDEDAGVRVDSALILTRSRRLQSLGASSVLEDVLSKLKRMVREKDVWISSGGAQALGAIADASRDPSIRMQVLEYLVGTLKTADVELRTHLSETVSRLLFRVTDVSVLEDVLQTFRGMLFDEDPRTSTTGARALGLIANTSRVPSVRMKAFEYLTEGVKADDSKVRARAAAAFSPGRWSSSGDISSAWKEQHVIPALIEAMKDDNQDVRRSAVRGLSSIVSGVRNSETLAPLIPLLLEQLREEHAVTRREAAWLLAHVAYKVNDETALQSITRELVKTLNDKDNEVRQAATSGLGNLASSSLDIEALRPIIPPLLEKLEDSDSPVRRLAMTALGGEQQNVSSGLLLKIRDDQLIRESIDRMNELLGDPDPEIRAQSAKALARLALAVGDKEAVQGVVETLREAFAKGELGGSRGAAETLISLAFSGSDGAIQESAGKAIAEALENGNADVRRRILRALDSSSYRARTQTAWELVIPGVISALEDKDRTLRASAARTLSRVAYEIQDQEVLKSVVQAFVKMLQNKDLTTRRVAAESLRHMAQTVRGGEGWKAVIQLLVDALKDDDRHVRGEIAKMWRYLMSKISDKTALEPAVQALTEAIQDEDSELSGRAAAAVGAFYAGMRQYDQAIRAYEKAAARETTSLGQGSDTATAALGDLYVAVGRYDKAIEAYRKAMQLDPDNQGYFKRKLTSVYAKAGRAEDADALYEGTSDPEELFEQMRIYAEQGLLDQLLVTGRQILSSPQAQWWHKHNAFSQLIYGYSKQSKLDDFMAILQQQAEEDPNEAGVYVALGQVYTKQRETRKALEMYERAAVLAPDRGDIQESLGRIYRQQGANAEAAKAYREAIRLRPSTGSNYSRLAEIYTQLGESERATELVAQWKQQMRSGRLGYSQASQQVTLGDICLAAKKNDEAITAYKKAIELEPKNERYYKGKLLRAYEQAGEQELAEELRATLPRPRISRPTAVDLTGQKAPEFTLKNLDGKEVTLADLRGEVTILNFWGSWCPPCVKEIPQYVELYGDYKDQGLVMIGVTVEFSSGSGMGGVSTDTEGMKAFVEEHSVNYPILMADGKVQQAYGGIRSVPTTFVLDKEGVIRKQYVGYRSKAVFEADIEALLAAKSLAGKMARVERMAFDGFDGRLKLHWNVRHPQASHVSLSRKKPER